MECIPEKEIIVIHEKGIPKLQGILKQRSTSESSDDVRSSSFSVDRQTSTATGSEAESDSPDSLSSSGGVKKSVSFSEHVDHAMYVANQSVSAMHAALKNKRRRQRKREQKLEQKTDRQGERRRRRSSGSMSMDSGDEQVVAAANVSGGRVEWIGDEVANDYVDDNEDEAVISEEVIDSNDPTDIARTGKDGDSLVNEAPKKHNEVMDAVIQKGDENESAACVIMTSRGSVAPRIDDTSLRTRNDDNGDILILPSVTDASGALMMKEPVSDGPSLTQEFDGDESIAAPGIEKRTLSKMEPERILVEEIPSAETDSKEEVCCRSADGAVDPLKYSSGGGGDQPQKSEQQDKTCPSSMLSWEDGGRDSTMAEHKTKCAVEFTNSVVFDLDVD